ncbi:hypothetical protein ABW20_dc0101745 [Dactylellina cionopaga]|nr:hypothetical protein ABW20_dc0101745 [Dactylellina cionopaga]
MPSFGHHRSHSRQDHDGSSSQGPDQLHTTGALLQAAQALSSIGKPSNYLPASSGPNPNPQHQAQTHIQQQHPTSPPQPPSLTPGSQPSMSYHQNPQLNPGGYGGYSGGNYPSTSPHPGSAMSTQSYSDASEFQRQNSFRAHDAHGAPPPPQPQQHSQRPPPQPQYSEYSSPIHIHQPQQPPPQQQQQQQQPPPQGYQAYPGGASRSHSTASGLSRSNTLASAHPPAGEPDANALYGDANTKYLPITHMQPSSGSSGLPLDPSQSSSYRKYAPGGGSMGQQDIAMVGGFGLDVQSRQGPITEAPPKEMPRGSHYFTQWTPYAIDWCKWPIYGSPSASGYAGQSGVGRLAVGSYSEDGHNYV